MTTLADAAYFAPPYPAVDGWLIYAGGDTPHPVTVAQMAGLPGGYRLPVWVRSNPLTNSPTADAAAFLVWLGLNKVPKGVLTVIDLETAVDPAYVNTYGAAMHAGGYFVLTYGSSSTLFNNPRVDGWFVADYTFVPHIVGGTVATQYADPGPYDLEDIASTSLLWNTLAPVIPPPSGPSKEVDMFLIVLEDDGAVGTKGSNYLVTDNGLCFVGDVSVITRLGPAAPVSNGQAVLFSAATPKK